MRNNTTRWTQLVPASQSNLELMKDFIDAPKNESMRVSSWHFLVVLGETELTKSSWTAGAGFYFSRWNQSGSKAMRWHVVEDARYRQAWHTFFPLKFQGINTRWHVYCGNDRFAFCLYAAFGAGARKRQRITSFPVSAASKHTCPVVNCGRVFDNTPLLEGHLKR